MSQNKGNLIFLKTFTSEDKKQIIEWDKDEEVSRYRELNWDKKLKTISFGIYDKNNSKLIGSLSISSIDPDNKHAEIGMAIGDKNYWSKGYGTDTVKTVLEYCFNQLNLNKVYLDVWEDNIRAINCYLKCGFKRDGVIRDAVLKNRKYNNKLIMSILKRELL